MKIIDRNTGKRIEPLKGGKEKITKKVEKVLDKEEYSPMDPPDAYDLNYTLNDVKVSDMNPLLQTYIKEHNKTLKELELFEQVMIEFKNNNYNLTQQISDAVGSFFTYFDDNIIDYNRREEQTIFPILKEKLLASGEHNADKDNPHTAVDLMEDDHVSFIQSASLIFNMLGLAARIPDPASRAVICDLAYHTAIEFIEQLKLHIFKEDHTLFPLAHKLISESEFKKIV